MPDEPLNLPQATDEAVWCRERVWLKGSLHSLDHCRWSIVGIGEESGGAEGTGVWDQVHVVCRRRHEVWVRFVKEIDHC